MKWSEKVSNFFKKNKLETTEQRAALTNEQFTTLASNFETEHEKTLTDAMALAKAELANGKQMADTMAQAATILAAGNGEEAPVVETPAPVVAAAEGEPVVEQPAIVNHEAMLSSMADLIALANTQQETITTLEQQERNPTPQAMKKPVMSITGGAHTPKYVLGIEAPFFERSKPWNAVMATGKPLESGWERDDEAAFLAAVNDYGKSLGARYGELQASSQLGNLKTLSSFDFSGFEDMAKMGDQYMVRRQDALISYLRSLPSVTGIFPVRYGVQDKMIMINSFFDSFSQAGQSGEVFKGGETHQPMIAGVKDVMMKRMFENMKDLEKQYIGYLNREGSDPIKWTFVEWILAQTMVALLNEQNERRIVGTYVPPVKGEAGHEMFASDGVIRQLLFNYTREGFLKPFSDFPTYTPATILVYIEEFIEKINQILPASLSGFTLYVNAKHLPWYAKAYRKEFGTDLDFTGAKATVMNYDIAAIQGVPNMGNSCFMFLSPAGNVELYEDKAGEMHKTYLERRLENLISASWWKEGVGAYRTGKKDGEIKDQFIFMNDPYTALSPDATTADGSVNTYFKSGVNTADKTLTDIVNASQGKVYTIVCGDITHVTKIVASGKFADVEAWTPKAVGDYIEVYLNPAGDKFIELGRKVTA